MERKCIFFIGAGMSIEAGLPSGRELADKLFKQLNPGIQEIPSDLSLPEMAEEYQSRLDRNHLESTIRSEIISRLGNADHKSFKLFANLHPAPEIVITTNYDKLIQQNLGDENYIPIFEDANVGQHSSANLNLYKIHGDIDYIAKAIITKSDIENYEKTNPVIYQKLISFFTTYHIIFLGFSVQDKHIQDIYKKCCAIQPRMPSAYVVDPCELQNLDDLGPNILHIKMTAFDFLDTITKELSDQYFTTVPIDQEVKLPFSNNNPFSIYSTEYFPEKNWEELLNNTFIPPMNFSLILDPGNTVIEGHRGSGKSMILKYLSFDAQKKRNFLNPWDKDNIGIYLKFKLSLTSTTTKLYFKGDSQNWVSYFMTYVNLLIAEETLTIINHAFTKQKDHFDEITFVQEIAGLFLTSKECVFQNNCISNLIKNFKRQRNQLSQTHTNYCDLPPDFLEQFFDVIKENVPHWNEKNLFILLDEYDNLDSDQQKVVNTLVKNRSFSYKIGVKLFEMTYEDINEKTLEINNDYTYVPTDRFDQTGEGEAYTHYASFIRRIANKRLEYYEYKNTVEELFPNQKDENKKGFENEDYSGFENIVKLSSGIIRDFLEISKDMIGFSNPWIIEGKKRDKIDPVSPNLQNTVIKIHSNIHYDLIKQIYGLEETTKKPKSESVRLLIDNFALIFQRILKGSTQKDEFRTVSGFQIKNVSKLSTHAANTIMAACSYRLLQVPLNPRDPQNLSRYILGDRYRLHRLLCPRFHLSISERWPKEINSEVINELFIDPEKTVDGITKYFLKNIPLSVSKKLEDYV